MPARLPPAGRAAHKHHGVMAVISAHPFPASRRRFSRLISWHSPGWTAVFIGGLILAGSLFGLATRSAGLLAAIWPTTAVLLGAMVRWPHLASPVGWAVVVIGLPVDNIVNGGLPGDALLQSSADLVGILTGYFMFSRLDAADRCLRHPMSVHLSSGDCRHCVRDGRARRYRRQPHSLRPQPDEHLERLDGDRARELHRDPAGRSDPAIDIVAAIDRQAAQRALPALRPAAGHSSAGAGGVLHRRPARRRAGCRRLSRAGAAVVRRDLQLVLDCGAHAAVQRVDAHGDLARPISSSCSITNFSTR